jgi:hypothetical protein
MSKSLAIGAVAALCCVAPAQATCTEISSQVVALTGCVDSQWQRIEGKSGGQEFVYQTPDGNFGLMVITEKDSFDPVKFRDAIVGNAVAGEGGDKKSVVVNSERVANIDGKPFSVLEYTTSTGSPILFQNFYYSKPGFGSVQILSYSLPADATAAAFNAGVFAATVKIGNGLP